jgi:hypothetical protein
MSIALKEFERLLQHSLRIRIQPKPLNLSERRQIYRELQRYGDILIFKSFHVSPRKGKTTSLFAFAPWGAHAETWLLLQYDPSYASDDTLVVFRDAQAADSVRAACPRTFSLTRREFDPVSLHWTHAIQPDQRKSPQDQNQRAERPSFPLGESIRTVRFDRTLQGESKEARKARILVPNPRDPSRGPLPEEVKFHVHAFPWQKNHLELLERSSFWGPFKLQVSMMQRTLAATVPMLGLSDIDVYQHSTPNFLTKRRRRQVEKEPTLREFHEQYQVMASKSRGEEGAARQVAERQKTAMADILGLDL